MKTVAKLVAPMILGAGPLAAQPPVLRPQLAGPSWKIASSPDLGQWTSPEQEVVDFAVWQAADGSWQAWSCVRKTRFPGATRLFHRWEGKRLTDSDWEPKGVAMTSLEKNGEREGSMQAPFVVRDGAGYLMYYSSGGKIFLARSADGKSFTRRPDMSGGGWLFGDGTGNGGRDPMVLQGGTRWYIYYTGNPNDQGVVYRRISTDLLHWGEPDVVAFGGRAGTNAYSAECPFVAERQGRFYLFRTQAYGKNAMTRVYHSADPGRFGINQDERYLLAELRLAAPEIIVHDGKEYIAYLSADLKGIEIAPLEWVALKEGARY